MKTQHATTVHPAHKAPAHRTHTAAHTTPKDDGAAIEDAAGDIPVPGFGPGPRNEEELEAAIEKEIAEEEAEDEDEGLNDD